MTWLTQGHSNAANPNLQYLMEDRTSLHSRQFSSIFCDMHACSRNKRNKNSSERVTHISHQDCHHWSLLCCNLKAAPTTKRLPLTTTCRTHSCWPSLTVATSTPTPIPWFHQACCFQRFESGTCLTCLVAVRLSNCCCVFHVVLRVADVDKGKYDYRLLCRSRDGGITVPWTTCRGFQSEATKGTSKYASSTAVL